MTSETVFTNARLVLEDRVMSGSLVVRDGIIAGIDEGNTSRGIDMDGDYIIPGLVELHTDHLEMHYSPRPGVRWNAISAIQSHDAQIAASGITTVFDCLRLGSDADDGFKIGEMRAVSDALAEARAQDRLRADHYVHLRCEVSASDVLDHFADFQADSQVRIVSLMDHAPGQRQFQSMEQYTLYFKIKRGLTDDAFAGFVARRQAASARYSDVHRKALAEACADRGITVASHDDATLDHVAEAIDLGVKLAEFPTSIAAAKASHRAGMSVMMGAPNVVRGGSHSGNIAATDLARAGVLDVLSSDYVPLSLIHAPFVLADEIEDLDLAAAFRLVTATPAKTVGLDDRGSLVTGKRADLVRVRRDSGVPVVRSVWRQGERVA
ncbi:alpha-D-ribose 1-methylphosphonate 5-triphosphate diphosphatase [Hoeflea sp. YIM 152468]|uniref:alpha-D-ribose 1-methylphosphonate 5-triphosphate diphosphatase n=1 Tax=Hoeflea sp. YIM 152468 TaxID=3031759 RepID=UPI0023DA7343|nr:alpha-D-ribose 1-methylphosphonate 5-triphosphate diphosphatase [Hoeflea sp. YIM 152468]MDF1609451.1 alpha-D-ribose 1-methylphosphonate 5-triphosphate diphosphatase [Hoeflea sp. YIM 152468]